MGKILNFFKSFLRIFGKDADLVNTIVSDSHALYVAAQPIVAAISAVITVEDKLNPSVGMKKVIAVMQTFITDAAMIDAFAAKHVNMPLITVLDDAAVLILGVKSGITIVNDLKLAVRLAYNVYAALNPTTTGNTQIQALVQ